MAKSRAAWLPLPAIGIISSAAQTLAATNVPYYIYMFEWYGGLFECYLSTLEFIHEKYCSLCCLCCCAGVLFFYFFLSSYACSVRSLDVVLFFFFIYLLLLLLRIVCFLSGIDCWMEPMRLFLLTPLPLLFWRNLFFFVFFKYALGVRNGYYLAFKSLAYFSPGGLNVLAR